MTAAVYVPSDRASILASFSGGKDSSALLLWLRECGYPFRAAYFDTGWEHEDTYAHIDYVEQALGITLARLAPDVKLAPHLVPVAERIETTMGRAAPSAFVRLCLQKGIFPRRTVRFCTSELKVAMARRWIREAHDEGLLPVNAVGIRAAESAARAKLAETELSPTLDVLVWRPLIQWSEADVVAIHQRHGLRLNPLYARGAERVGCWPCIMGNKRELRMLAKDERRIEAIRQLEAAVREVNAERAAARGETDVRLPTLFASPRRDDAGTRPGMLIDDAIAWAKTARGVAIEQGRLFDDPEDPDAGCMRWGMCEHPDAGGES